MKKKLVVLRRTVQILFFLLFVYILWSTTYPLTGIFPTAVFFTFNPLIMIFTSLSERVFLSGIFAAVFMLVLTLLIGRFFCGWVCPMGAMLDFFGWLNPKKEFIKKRSFRNLRNIKYYLLFLIAVFAIFGMQLAWGLDPLVITARFVSLNFIPAVTSGLDAVLVWLIKSSHRYEPLLDIYRWLSASILGVKVHYFAHALITLAGMFLVLATVFLSRRFWCRAICPLGALYALSAKYSLQKRIKEGCVFCGQCPDKCRMAAIAEDASYESAECILCMDCIYDCPANVTRFGFRAGSKEGLHKKKEKGISRRQFLGLISAATVPLAAALAKKRFPGFSPVDIIRPPGALVENDFLDRCIRCGNCMEVCPTNGLQPAMFEAGYEGIWTPRLVPSLS